MEFIGLMSGGKDSIMSIMQCIAEGHKLSCVGNLYPESGEETDSYMYQTVGSELVHSIAECIGVPLFIRPITKQPINLGLVYEEAVADEVEDLYLLLKEIKEKMPAVRGVCTGAIWSDYQRLRVENVCRRLGLNGIGFLWNMNQKILLNAFTSWEVEAIIVKICSMGLENKHLGKTISSLTPYFNKLNDKFGFHECGEGGEFETVVLDCPLYKKRIVIKSAECIEHDPNTFSPVSYLRITDLELVEKGGLQTRKSCCERIRELGLLYPLCSFHQEVTHFLTPVDEEYKYVGDEEYKEHQKDEETKEEIEINLMPANGSLQNNAPPPIFRLGQRYFTVSGLNSKGGREIGEEIRDILSELSSMLGGSNWGLISAEFFWSERSGINLCTPIRVESIVHEVLRSMGISSMVLIHSHPFPNITYGGIRMYCEGYLGDSMKEDITTERERGIGCNSLNHYKVSDGMQEGIRIGGLLYLRTALPLRPHDMTISYHSIILQFSTAIRNLKYIIAHFYANIHNIRLCFIYVTSTYPQFMEINHLLHSKQFKQLFPYSKFMPILGAHNGLLEQKIFLLPKFVDCEKYQKYIQYTWEENNVNSNHHNIYANIQLLYSNVNVGYILISIKCQNENILDTEKEIKEILIASEKYISTILKHTEYKKWITQCLIYSTISVNSQNENEFWREGISIFNTSSEIMPIIIPVKCLSLNVDYLLLMKYTDLDNYIAKFNELLDS